MRFDLYDPFNLAKLNCMTKYPSIETYHKLGDRGRLTEERNHEWPDEPVYVTEKIDGVNARMIFLPGRNMPWLIGSREELVAASSDVVWNNASGIASTLLGSNAPKPWMLPSSLLEDGYIFVAYFEVYGHRATSHWKEYASEEDLPFGALFRLLDATFFQQDWLNSFESLEEVARVRDNDGAVFIIEDRLDWYARTLGVERVPNLASMNGASLPKTTEGMDDMMSSLGRETQAGVNDKGRSEGIVLRTNTRDIIAKARRESYDKTLGDRCL